MEEYIQLLQETASRLNLNIENTHYEENKDYYWNNKGQLKTVIDKKIPDDKLKIIFQTHIQKLNKNQDNNNEVQNERIIEYPPVKIINTNKYSVYSWA